MTTKTICLTHQNQTESETLAIVKEMHTTMPDIVMSPKEWLRRRTDILKRK